MSEHALGPWEATNGNEIIDRDGFTVAIIDEFSRSVFWQKANPKKVWYMHKEGRKERSPEEVATTTCLIAAAPEMYEALMIVRDYLAEEIEDKEDDIFRLVFNSISYALAKAEGREVR